ncbi:hypothetical protein TDB9533_04206 [Thalassocella blandensis]|nr:hypothetical protein TDB9533_04206 [Thalassocella blandensis]
MNDTTKFPIEELKDTINDILEKLKPAETQLRHLGKIENGEEALEENTRADINGKFSQDMHWTDETQARFDEYEQLNPSPFELSELNYARTVLKRLNLVATNIVRLTYNDQEKAMAEMEYHMRLANNMSQIHNK